MQGKVGEEIKTENTRTIINKKVNRFSRKADIGKASCAGASSNTCRGRRGAAGRIWQHERRDAV